MTDPSRPADPTPRPDERTDDDEEEGEALWGPDGPAVGQVITIKGTSMQTRWTGTHWELLP